MKQETQELIQRFNHDNYSNVEEASYNAEIVREMKKLLDKREPWVTAGIRKISFYRDDYMGLFKKIDAAFEANNFSFTKVEINKILKSAMIATNNETEYEQYEYLCRVIDDVVEYYQWRIDSIQYDKLYSSFNDFEKKHAT